MVDEIIFKDLKEIVRKYFEDGSGHDFNHTERVYNLALIISDKEDVDLDVIKAAALLHDIARNMQDGGNICHAEEGAKIAKEILEEMNFPDDKIRKVIHCIEVHRYSKGLKAAIREAEILQDADRLDSLGAIAISRPFERGGKKGRVSYGRSKSETTLEYIEKRLPGSSPDTFKTPGAKKIATERYKYTMDFVSRFKKEIRGEL
jgi:uncharacterized protein